MTSTDDQRARRRPGYEAPQGWEVLKTPAASPMVTGTSGGLGINELERQLNPSSGSKPPPRKHWKAPAEAEVPRCVRMVSAVARKSVTSGTTHRDKRTARGAGVKAVNAIGEHTERCRPCGRPRVQFLSVPQRSATHGGGSESSGTDRGAWKEHERKDLALQRCTPGRSCAEDQPSREADGATAITVPSEQWAAQRPSL